MGKLANFAVRRRDWGLKRVLHWEVMNALAKLGARVHYVNVDANVRAIERPELPPGHEARFAGHEEMLRYAGRVPGIDREFLDMVFARGDICIGNFRGDELLGFAFISLTRARATDQLDVLIPEGFHYIYKGWTHPDHRQAKLTTARIYLRQQLVRSNRGQWSISYTETHNYVSLLHGYRHPRERTLRMGFCGWITLFGRQIPFNSRRARWIGFELIRKDDDGRRQYVW